ASGAEPARETFVREIEAQTLAALRRRAARLGIDFRQIGLAALALLDARLTGNERVPIADPVSADLAHEFIVPLDADVDEWLRTAGRAGAPGETAEQVSEIGTWVADDAATPARVPIAWGIDPAHDAQLRAKFDRACLDPAAVELLAQVLGSILRGLATEQRLRQVSALDPEMRSRLQAWNGPAVARDPNDTVHGLFARCAQVHPQRCAVVCGAASLSYHELNVRADRIAAALHARGIGADALVAVLLERSVDAVTALLGILKAGAAYLPLDTAQPAERLAKVLTDARAALVIGRRGESAGESPTPFAAIEDLQADEAAFDAPKLSSNARAYVMYTSGSTGEPKGVEIEHRAIIRLVREVDYVQFGTEPRVLHAAPLGFDASTFEIWGALLNGGTVVIHDEVVPTGKALAATIRDHRVQIAWLTATLFNTLVDEDPGYLQGLEQLLIGGEALSVPHVRKALAALPDLTIINGYGPTECTTFTACHRIPHDLPADAPSIPIGRPIANTVARVVNLRGELVPIGVTGELWIGGAGVARGYLGRPDLTAEKFIPDPFGTPDERLYRSGDLVRWLPEGALEFVGRADGQIKLRGHRIEIGEIEAVLRGHPRICSAAVLLREDSPGRKRLAAYYVEESSLSPATLRAWLSRRLPDYMLPSAYVRLKALPLTANGKLDRRALPAPDARRPELSVDYTPPRGAAESRICQLFAEMIGLDQVGRHDNFFELGGDSLLATRALASLQREGHALSIAQFFAAPTAAGLAALPENRGERALEPSRLGVARDTQRHEPIAIIAMAGRFPGAADIETFWRKLCDGEETIRFFKPDELDPAIP
ncbi:MAG TPA: amino acid adenylation domain-containing protein, partial [Rhodanobacteraceae bacterium]|nr:amino acid adenylation domain-containing protein [Rhodanobacteraceae bacterium]